MRPVKLLAAAILVGLAGASCAGQTQDAPLTPAQTIDELEISVQAPGEMHVGDHVNLRLMVRNPTEAPLELHGSLPGYRYDFHVTDGQGVEVWSSLFNIAIPDPRASWTIPSGQEVTYDRIWTGLDNDGQTVSPGDYSIKGNLLLWGSTIGQPGMLMPDSPPIEITILP